MIDKVITSKILSMQLHFGSWGTLYGDYGKEMSLVKANWVHGDYAQMVITERVSHLYLLAPYRARKILAHKSCSAKIPILSIFQSLTLGLPLECPPDYAKPPSSQGPAVFHLKKLCPPIPASLTQDSFPNTPDTCPAAGPENLQMGN